MSQEANPFAPPRADIGAPQPDGVGIWDDASTGTRFLNVIVDSIGRFVLAAILAVLFRVLGGGETGAGRYVLTGASVLFYYVLFEWALGWTPGKLLTGTRVVREDGGKPRLSQIIGRTLARFVPFEPFSFLGGRPTGWHDRWSGTRVIRTRR